MPTTRERYTALEQPCRNFNILATAVVVDPADGREKFVLSNFVAGGTGNLILIDTLTGEGESIPLPGDCGAWGLVNYRNEKLIVGTCPNHAYLHCLDLKTRTWAEPLRDENEKYFWNMCIGSDGCVYGGTWPGCSLLRYDPERHVLENVGRVSDNPKNLYSRPVNGDLPGYILVAGGYDEPFLKAWSMETRTFFDFGTPGAVVREVTPEFICTEKDGQLEFFDPKTFERLDDAGLESKLSHRHSTLPNGQRIPVKPLANGRFAGVRGQDYFVIGGLEEVPVLKRIPVPAPPTGIHTLTSDEEGTLWGSCGFGQTIFRYNPRTGEYWNSSSVCNAGGEVYGMVFLDGKLYMSSYVGGDHIVYDPRAPWDQLNNVNPKTLRPVRPQVVRPEGRSVLGPDGAIWTGWSAKYGTYGGGLSRIDPATHEVEFWYDPIPEQQVAGLAADDRYLYFTTNGGASGLPYKEEPCHFGVWSTEGRLIFKHRFEEGPRTGAAIVAAGGKVLVRVGAEIAFFDPDAMQFERRIRMDADCSWMVRMNDGEVAAFCGNALWFIDVQSAQARMYTELPGHVRAAAVTPSGELYFAVGSTLYRVNR
jgi:sugar lactone lactonase YvrE